MDSARVWEHGPSGGGNPHYCTEGKVNKDMTAPSLTHMEAAKELTRKWVFANDPTLVSDIARALTAEHDATLEKAAARATEIGDHFTAHAIRAMKGASDE